MGTALVTGVTFLVFGIFWLQSQDWYDLIPKTTQRSVAFASLCVLGGAFWLVPNAAQGGLHRFIDYTVAQTMTKVQPFLDSIGHATVRPQPTHGTFTQTSVPSHP